MDKLVHTNISFQDQSPGNDCACTLTDYELWREGLNSILQWMKFCKTDLYYQGLAHKLKWYENIHAHTHIWYKYL